MVAAYPVDCTLNLAVATWHTGLCIRIVLSVNGSYLAVLVLLATCTLNDICILEAHLVAWSHTEVLLWSILHKVIALNPQLAAKLNSVGC